VKIAEQEIGSVTVLGYGVTGRALTAYLHNHAVSVFVSESGKLEKSDQDYFLQSGISYEQAGHSPQCLETADMVVLSPAVRPDTPILQEAKRRKIGILSEIDLAWLLLPHGIKLIAVTGTNGKTTTVSVIEAILNQAGISAKALGNIGTPLIASVDSPPEVIVVEVSSFQLEQSRFFHPDIACILNITPDHLDWHGSMDNYISAKSSIFARQNGYDVAVLSHHLPIDSETLIARKRYIEDIHLPHKGLFERLAYHNLFNLRAAIACCMEIDPGLDVTKIGLEKLDHLFHLPYRLQKEPSIGGITVINDSKSTNAASAIAALESVHQPCVMILGGKHKQGGYEKLAYAIRKHEVRHVVLFGSGGAFIEGILRDAGYMNTTLCSTLDQALICALERAHDLDAVIFSPACSSFDQYDNYIDRGQSFSRLVRAQLRRESDFF
jgi:UDP-N-acetylmuramoylalanine--D-glutamate ligase